MIKVVFLRPLDLYRRSLRRISQKPGCTTSRSAYHSASVVTDPELRAAEYPASGAIPWDRNDPLWPKECGCGAYLFAADDHWSVDHRQLFHHPTAGTISLSDVPPGSCWDAPWFHDWRTGPDGRSLIVQLPNRHNWFIDGIARNCARRDDAKHRCWVRHGRPEDGTLHVDKNGETCSAGAGSIDAEGWHGHLHNGHLVAC